MAVRVLKCEVVPTQIYALDIPSLDRDAVGLDVAT